MSQILATCHWGRAGAEAGQGRVHKPRQNKGGQSTVWNEETLCVQLSQVLQGWQVSSFSIPQQGPEQVLTSL